MTGQETHLTEHYFADALIPALTRLGFGPVGAFSVYLGPETPTYYLVIPGSSLETLVTLELHLAQDEEFMKAADPFWNAPASAPPFVRFESSLMAAFPGWPRIVPPPAAATKGKRIFQLRTYESATDQDHVRKVEMFHHGEFQYFKEAGFNPVFFSDTVIGPRMPNLTYMLSLDSLEELDTKWAAFGNNPGWKKLSADPRYSFEPTVNHVTNLILHPLSSSQI
jgi:hypothetical protein